MTEWTNKVLAQSPYSPDDPHTPRWVLNAWRGVPGHVASVVVGRHGRYNASSDAAQVWLPAAVIEAIVAAHARQEFPHQKDSGSAGKANSKDIQ